MSTKPYTEDNLHCISFDVLHTLARGQRCIMAPITGPRPFPWLQAPPGRHRYSMLAAIKDTSWFVDLLI